MDLHELVRALAVAAQPWRRLYAESAVVSTAVMFVHVAALIVAAGSALAADRATWRVARAHHDDDERAHHVADLRRAHPVVIGGLALVLASGALLALSDVETYALAPLFWGKMLLVAALLANGWLMTRAERALRRAAAVDDAAGERRAWRTLRRAAAASAALWMAAVLAGTSLATV